MAGDFTVSNDNSDPSIAAATGNTTKSITVNLSTGTNATATSEYIDISNGYDVYVFLPCMTSKNLSVKIYNTDGYYMEKTASTATLERNKVYSNDINITSFDKYAIYYSVSPTKKVLFAPGNLWYRARGAKGEAAGVLTHNTRDGAKQGVFTFAPHQYSMIGMKDTNIASDYHLRIDLIGWGLSTCTSARMPWRTDTNKANYGNKNNDITNTKWDWGWYNEIATDDGSTVYPYGTWYMLLYTEWDYLLGTRSGVASRNNATDKVALATVGDTIGMIILPDLWITPSGLTFTPRYNSRGYRTNVYTFAQWAKMEAAGATFLPACRCRTYSKKKDAVVALDESSTLGTYWTGSYGRNQSIAEDQVYVMHFNYSTSGSSSSTYVGYTTDQTTAHRYHGRAIRLARDYVEE